MIIYNFLEDTIDYMRSSDYKERFIAEYWQTKIRYDRLHELVVKYDANVINFKPNCPIELLKKQLSFMGNYLYILEVRAKIEDIDLEIDL